MPNAPYPYEVNWQIGHGKWFLNTNLFLIKPFLITKFDCTCQIPKRYDVKECALHVVYLVNLKFKDRFSIDTSAIYRYTYSYI